MVSTVIPVIVIVFPRVQIGNFEGEIVSTRDWSGSAAAGFCRNASHGVSGYGFAMVGEGAPKSLRALNTLTPVVGRLSRLFCTT